jgi:hypothetical protein
LSAVDPAHRSCAHPLPDFAISTPGRISEAHTAQVVAYLAVIGTPKTVGAGLDGPAGTRVSCGSTPQRSKAEIHR